MKFAALCLLAAAVPAWGADQWVRLTTPHFELYTTAGERKGRAAILYFEQVRSFVLQATHGNWDQAVPVRIIAFKSEKEYRPYAFNAVSAAFYTGSQSRDYIVMEDVEEEHFPIAIHEYMHLVVRRSGLKLPTWLNEGWADVYSTLKPLGKTALVGSVIRSHAQELAAGKWLDLKTLTSVSEKSADYNEKNRVGIFYSESWALTHMLYLGKDYNQKFSQFLVAVAGGEDSEKAFETVYQRTPAAVYADLQSYLSHNVLNVAVFDIKLEKSAEEAVLSPVTDLDSSVALADVLAATGKRAEAKARYEKLAAQYPGTSEISRSLGYLAWQEGDRETARKYFEEALPGTEDPQMCYHLASLYRFPTDDKIVAALLTALKLKPDYTEARLRLGYVMLNRRNTEGALASFIQIQHVTSQYAAELFTGLAYAYAQKDDLPNARKNLDLAFQWVKTDAEKQRADALVKSLDAHEEALKHNAALRAAAATKDTAQMRPEPESSTGAAATTGKFIERNPFVRPGEVVQRAEGLAKALDCEGKKANFVVAVGNVLMKFEITDPDRVILRHDGKEKFEFTCGPQKNFPVAVEYVPDTTLGRGVAGSVRKIEF